MRNRSLTAILLFLLALNLFAADGVKPAKPDLEALYTKAFAAFDGGRYDEALETLDTIDARQPDLAESLNLRGVVYMRQGNYDKAETALRKALSVEPRFWNASFNLAEIPFLQKNWEEARDRFTKLIGSENNGLEPETNQLIQYKLFLTFVMQGKEKTADWIVNKFEANKESPALYYSNAAVALQHDNKKEADEWIDAANKQFSTPLNKLYAESFYEVGWMQKPEGEGRAALEVTSTTERVERLKADANANFEKAERAFQQRDFEEALKSLELVESGRPNDPATMNLRGEILMEQGKLDEAEEAFQNAFKVDPKFKEAEYNLAQIPFKKREYAKARDRFEALFAATPGGDKNQAAQLIKYKIFMTLLLEGKEPEAKQMMDQFKFTGDTPALYYAQAAWEFKHDREDEGRDWVSSARKIYSPGLNIVFGDSFYDLGWLKAAQSATAPTSALAQAEASPGTDARPEMRTGQADSVPGPEGSPGVASRSPSSVKASPAATAIAAANPAVTPPAVAPAGAVSTTTAAIPKPTVSSTGAMLAANQARVKNRPTFVESGDHIAGPRSYLVGVLLLAGILLLAWVVVQNFRRNMVAPTAVAELPLKRRTMGTQEDRRVSRDALAGGPPQISIQLKGSEPAVRAPVLPSGVITARGAAAGVNEPPVASPNEPREVVLGKVPVLGGPLEPVNPPNESISRSEEEAIRPRRDQEEISVPAAASTAAEEKPEPVETVSSASEEVAPATADQKAAEEPVVSAEEPVVSAEERVVSAEEPVVSVEERVVSDEEPVGAAAEDSAIEEPAVQPVELEPVLAEAEAIAVEEPIADREEVELPEEPAPIEEPALASAEIASPEAARPEGDEVSEEWAEEPEFEVPVEALDESFEESEEPMEAFEESEVFVDEPVGQGQPIPHLTTAFSPEPIISEIAQPELESELILIEPEEAVAASIAGREPGQSSIETPSFASKIITTEPIRLQPTTPDIMPETTITTAPSTRPASPTVSVQQPAGGMHTAVQLTFSLEIASMQLTPTFKMSGLQLKPMSKVVSMRIAPSQDPQPPMNLQVTFEVSRIDLSNGGIGSIRLTPSAQQKPAVITSPSFAISGLELVAGSGAGPVQLTPSHQEQASVQLTAEFQIAAIEFTPSFEIATIVLNSTSRRVLMQLPGAGPSSIDNAPIFEMENVQVSEGGRELGLIQVTPGGSRPA